MADDNQNPKRRGRPSKGDAGLTTSLTIRVSKLEREAWHRAALAEGISLGQYVTKTVRLAGLPVVASPATALADEIRRKIGALERMALELETNPAPEADGGTIPESNPEGVADAISVVMEDPPEGFDPKKSIGQERVKGKK